MLRQITHKIAKNTSVTRNRFSTVQGSPGSPMPSLKSKSPKKVRAQRKPHHMAGAVLKARAMSKGMCHDVLTPSKTAMRGWRAGGGGGGGALGGVRSS